MSLNQIKRKIQSIKSTAKITNAMALIATTKLKKQRDLFESIKDYFNDFYNVVGFLLHEVKNLELLNVKNAQNKTAFININSSMGLCGAYNALLDEHVSELVKSGDYVFQFGKQGVEYWKYQTKITDPIYAFYDYHEQRVPFTTCLDIANQVLALWKEGKINSIKINFMRFINVLTAKPTTLNVLPFDPSVLMNKHSEINVETFEFNPSMEQLLTSLIPEYIANMIYGSLIEAKLSEYALRRNAMDNATKNAEQLGAEYKLAYNNARQAQITTEIIEIISSSNALSEQEKEKQKEIQEVEE